MQAPRIKTPAIYDFSDPALYNAAYLPVFGVKSRFVHLYGSAGSGKSNFGFQREIVESFEPRRRGRKTLVVRQTYNTLKDSCYADLKAIIEAWQIGDCFELLKSPLSITNKITDVEFIFRGLDDVEKLKSVKGVDRVIIEEATEIESSSDLDQISLRLRGFEEAQIVLLYNPTNEFHWLNTEYHQVRDDAHYILKTTYRDNRFLDAAYIESLEKLKDRNPRFYKIYVLGEWGRNAEGLIYPDYQTVAAMPPIQGYGLDFGYNDPCALVAVAVEDAPGIEGKNLYWQELLYETHLTSDLLIRRFEALRIDKRLRITADSARPEMIADLRRAGFNVQPCAKHRGSIVEGINEVKKYNLKLAAGGKNLFKEIANYVWKTKNGRLMDDEPSDSVNHLMDAGRYATEAAAPPQLVQHSDESLW